MVVWDQQQGGKYGQPGGNSEFLKMEHHIQM